MKPKKYDYIVKTRIETELYQALIKYQQQAGDKTLSASIRRLILSMMEKPTPSVIEREQLGELLGQLNGLGNNLNQLVRQGHMENKVDQAAIAAIIPTITDLAAKVRKALKYRP